MLFERKMRPVRVWSAAVIAAVVAGGVLFAGGPSLGTESGGCAESDMFKTLACFHGHTCAGSIIGARLGRAAKDALRAAGATGKLTVTVYTDSCPVDGVQVGAGTTYGANAIKIVNRNECRVILSDATGRVKVEAALTKLANEKRERSLAGKKALRDLAPEAKARKEYEKQEQELLEWFRTASDSELIRVRRL